MLCGQTYAINAQYEGVRFSIEQTERDDLHVLSVMIWEHGVANAQTYFSYVKRGQYFLLAGDFEPCATVIKLNSDDTFSCQTYESWLAENSWEDDV